MNKGLFAEALRRAGALCLSLVAVVGGWTHAGIVAAQTPAVGAGQAASTLQYRLARGDTIRITVFQVPDLSLETRITEAGTISYPLLGAVQMAGMTIAEAEQRISSGLRDGNFVRQPQVSITILQARGNQVSVLGQVGRPGRYPLETGQVRLTDILATAGGVTAGGGDLVVVQGVRNGSPYRVEVDLPSVFSNGGRARDVVLQNDDVIWVERAGIIYLYGEVQRPGSLRLERNMTVMQALASAGGLTQRGTLRGLRVSRKDTQGIPLELEPKLTDILRADDVVFVRESVF